MGADSTLWEAYREQLAAVLGISNPETCKDTTSFRLADWEVLDITGLPGADQSQATALQSLYLWGDSMPIWSAADYERGNGFYDMYRAFLSSLNQSDSSVTAAIGRLSSFRMPAGATLDQSYPAYSINPPLAAWYLAALQSIASGRPPMLDVTVQWPAPEPSAAKGPLARAPLRAAAATNVPAALPFMSYTPPATPTARSLRGASTGPSPLAARAQAVLEGVESSSDDTTFQFTAQSVETFDVSVGGWYDSSMLPLYHSRIRPDSAMSGATLFGEDGVLNLRASQIVVALGRTLTIRSSASYAGQVRSAVAQGGALSAGGFSFQLTDPHTSVVSPGGGETVVLKDNVSAPYVVAVVVQELG